MYARKLLSLVSTAVFAVVMLAGCGGSNFSSAAAKDANKAQSTVVFETDARLTNSLQDALEASADPTAIRQAMVEDDNMDELLKSGYHLDVLTVGGSDGDAAADALAEYIKDIVSGREKEGYISLVKADNGSFYAAILTYRNGGSGGSGGGDNPGGTTDPDDPNNPGGGGIDDENTEYNITINVEGDENGGFVTPTEGTTTNQSFKFTVTTNEGYEATVTANGKELTGDDEYTLSGVTGDTTVTVTFAKKVYSVEIVSCENGTAKPNSCYVEVNSTAEFTITANSGWRVVGVTVVSESNKDKTGDITVTPMDNNQYKVMIPNVQDNLEVTVLFEKAEPVIDHIEVTQNGPIYAGDKITEDNLIVKAYDENGNEIQDAELTLSTVKPESLTEDDTISVTYTDKDGNGYTDYDVAIDVTPRTHTVTVLWDKSKGSVSVEEKTTQIKGGFTVEVEDGESLDIAVSADIGYNIQYVDNACHENGNGYNSSYKVNSVKSDITVTVVYGTVDIKEMNVDTGGIKKPYWCTDDLELSKIELTVTYNDDRQETVEVTDDMIQQVKNGYFNLNKFYGSIFDVFDVWEAKFKISYKGETENFNVYVKCGRGNTSVWSECCSDWDGTATDEH